MDSKTSFEQLISRSLFSKTALAGGVLALALIVLFLSGVDHPDPAWPKYWQLRPLIVVPIAGALGGAALHFLVSLVTRGGWLRVLSILAGLVVYVVALWLGTVLGLDGTLWN